MSPYVPWLGQKVDAHEAGRVRGVRRYTGRVAEGVGVRGLQRWVGVLWAVWGLCASASDWEVVSKGALSVRARPLPERPELREVWLETELAAEARAVQAVLRDHDNFWRWMPLVKESRVVEERPGNERVTYTRVAPPLVATRDFVCRAVDERLLEEDGTGEFVQRWKVEEGVLPERKGVVRLRHNQGHWRLVPRGPERTFVEYRFSLEPGGSVPLFLANLGQRESLADLMRALEKRARQVASQQQTSDPPGATGAVRQGADAKAAPETRVEP